MLRFLLSTLLLASASLAGAAPPELVSVEPMIYRDAWFARQQNPGRDIQSRGIGQYEKFELEIDLKATFENPFDPEQIDLWAEFTAPHCDRRLPTGVARRRFGGTIRPI